MKWFKRFFEKPKPISASRLYSADEVPESIETLEASMSRLMRYEPLVKHLPALEELIDYEMAYAVRVQTDPAYSQEQANFFRGSFWLTKQIGQKLVGLGDEIRNLDQKLTEAKKKPENIIRR